MQQPVSHHHGKLWHFSEEEKKHLMLATCAFTLALSLMYVGGLFSISNYGIVNWVSNLIAAAPVMLFGVGPAFVLHEMGHKLMAKHYGCWAEFRGDPNGLQTGLLISAVFGIVFMAPGAVVVSGMVTKNQNGHIAIAGPLVNLVLFFIGLPLGILVLGLTNSWDPSAGFIVDSGVLNWKLGIYSMVHWWLLANAILGLFNMLPFGPLDGKKIKGWSEMAWLSLLTVFAVLTFASFVGYPMGFVTVFAELLFS